MHIIDTRILKYEQTINKWIIIEEEVLDLGHKEIILDEEIMPLIQKMELTSIAMVI